eukprot:3164623-Lingulodinium_polyedra.AAC.1
MCIRDRLQIAQCTGALRRNKKELVARAHSSHACSRAARGMRMQESNACACACACVKPAYNTAGTCTYLR